MHLSAEGLPRNGARPSPGPARMPPRGARALAAPHAALADGSGIPPADGGMVHQHKSSNPSAEQLRQFRHPSGERPVIISPAGEGSPAIPTSPYVTPTTDDVDAKRSCHRAPLSVSPKLQIVRDRARCAVFFSLLTMHFVFLSCLPKQAHPACRAAPDA